MSQERVVDIIEDRKRYKDALRRIWSELSKMEWSRTFIQDLISDTNVMHHHPVPSPGPWPVLTDHIARCQDCEPTKDVQEHLTSILGIHLCQNGKSLMTTFYDHQCAVRSKANREALK